jgi:hypothetical protein
MRTTIIITVCIATIGLVSIFWNVYNPRIQEPELTDWEKAIIEQDEVFAFEVKEWIHIQTEYISLQRDPVIEELIGKYIASLNRTRD